MKLVPKGYGLSDPISLDFYSQVNLEEVLSIKMGQMGKEGIKDFLKMNPIYLSPKSLQYLTGCLDLEKMIQIIQAIKH